jgi:mRNA interferase RelE/StbE
MAIHYQLEYKPEAMRDLAKLSPDVARRVVRKLEVLRHDLAGNVKRLVDYKPGWRLRVGDWRVLFEVVGPIIIVYNVVHRSKAYE